MANKKKITIKSPTQFANNIKKKWLAWGVSSVVVMFVGIMFLNNDPQQAKKRASTAPEFTDATPDNPNQEVMLSRIQSQLYEMNSKADKERSDAQKREESLRKELRDLKAEQEAALQKALERQKNELEAQIKSQPPKPIASTDTEGGVFIPINKKDDDGSKVPPPPPIFVADKDKDSAPTNNRGNLPQNVVQAGDTQRGTPMIITGTLSSDDVIHGSSAISNSEKKKPIPNMFLPAGSFVKGTLITGADFGAGSKTQKNPQPVLIQIQNDAVLPGKAQYKLKDCFAIANGYGELSSERAYLQGTRLSCVQSGTGKVLEANILAYVADSDGKLGMRGVLKRRSGMLLGKALLAGFADGASKVLTTTASNAESTITGSGVVSSIDTSNAGKMAMWSGASNAMEKLADQYIKEADSIFPVIEVDSGRNITMIFQNGQELKWKEPKVEGDEDA